MPLSVYVNGARSRHNCPSRSNVQVKLPASPDDAFEPETVDLPGPKCTYVYSAYRTPQLTGECCTRVDDLDRDVHFGIVLL